MSCCAANISPIMLFLRTTAYLFLALACFGCTKTGSAGSTYSGGYPIRAVCTTGMVADLVREVGGSHVNITQLMGEGVDPHLYKASPGDVSALNGAEIIFYSGLHLEGKMA